MKVDFANSLDQICLEIARPTMKKGVLIWFGLIAGLGPFFVGSLMAIGWQDLTALNILVIGGLVLSICTWTFFVFFKMELTIPVDEPIRFNRARQRVYAYNYKFTWWNPFKRWYIAPVAYDWAQVRAERWNKRATTAQGALIIKWGVVLSIVEPGTNKVIDRFPLSTMGADEFMWAYICIYMQHGPAELTPPISLRVCNEVPWYNIALHFASKVEWPAEMDLESRTAP